MPRVKQVGYKGKRPMGESSGAAATDEPPRTRARQAPGTSTPYPPIVFKDTYHESQYQRLSRREIQPTKYIDPHALEKLGLTTRVTHRLNRIGWGEFATITPRTYRELTLEFLSSFHFRTTPVSNEQAKFEFRLMNKDYVVNEDTVNTWFGWGDMHRSTQSHGFDQQSFWQEITGLETKYDSAKSKASAIIDPSLRYLHRFLANSLTGRGLSQGVVNQVELRMLWFMVKSNYTLNTAMIFGERLMEVAKQSKGAILIGGLITRIAEQLGIFDQYRTNLKEVEGKNRIDLELLRSMGLATVRQGEYILARHPRAPPASDDEEEEEDAEEDEEPQEAGAREEAEEGAARPARTQPSMQQIMDKLDNLSVQFNARFDTLEAKQRSIEANQ